MCRASGAGVLSTWHVKSTRCISTVKVLLYRLSSCAVCLDTRRQPNHLPRVHRHKGMRPCLSTGGWAYIYIYTYLCIYIYIYTYLSVYIIVYIYIYTHPYMYVYIHTYNAHIRYTYIYIYIYIYMVPPPPHGSAIFVCFRAPPHENCRSLRGGASRWTFLWLGELHPGPIEFNRGRLSSIGGRIEDWRFRGTLLRESSIFNPAPDWVQSGAGLKIEDSLENFLRESSIFNLQSGPRLSSDWVQSGAGLKIEDSLENFLRESSIFNLQSGSRLSSIGADWVQSGPLECNRVSSQVGKLFYKAFYGAFQG